MMFTLTRTRQVDVFLHMHSPKPAWERVGSLETDSHGKIMFGLPKDCLLPLGYYPVKFLVK